MPQTQKAQLEKELNLLKEKCVEFIDLAEEKEKDAQKANKVANDKHYLQKVWRRDTKIYQFRPEDSIF